MGPGFLDGQAAIPLQVAPPYYKNVEIIEDEEDNHGKEAVLTIVSWLACCNAVPPTKTRKMTEEVDGVENERRL